MAATPNRIPTQVLTSKPQGSANPAVVSNRSVAPPNVRTLGPALPRLQRGTFAENRQQSAVLQALGKVKARYDADQDVIPGVAFVAGQNTVVPHRLGRPFIGVNLVNPRGGYLAFQIAGNTDVRLDAFQAIVNCQHNVTADVVVW